MVKNIMKYLMWVPIIGFVSYMVYYFTTFDDESVPKRGIFYWGVFHLVIIYLTLFYFGIVNII